ncbi:MAG: hypothetical protein FD138_2059 [Planctomycetota bacterium]|nr:MAG: hypothetical protein FD138_2059 [Planctomycetota bacterium]
MPTESFRSCRLLFAALVVVVWGTSVPSVALADDAAAAELFESKIRPVLVEVCFKCHGGDKDSGSLRVDSRETLLKGGDTSPAIVPGKPGESLLLKAIRHSDDDLKMPPDKRLPDETKHHGRPASPAAFKPNGIGPSSRLCPAESRRPKAEGRCPLARSMTSFSKNFTRRS